MICGGRALESFETFETLKAQLENTSVEVFIGDCRLMLMRDLTLWTCRWVILRAPSQMDDWGDMCALRSFHQPHPTRTLGYFFHFYHISFVMNSLHIFLFLLNSFIYFCGELVVVLCLVMIHLKFGGSFCWIYFVVVDIRYVVGFIFVD
ncbi:hypothetical protein ACOSQ4_013191 [Xanthoceras sorbifolium]